MLHSQTSQAWWKVQWFFWLNCLLWACHWKKKSKLDKPFDMHVQKKKLCFLCHCAQTAHTRLLKIGSSGKRNANSTCTAAIIYSIVQRFFPPICRFGRYMLTVARYHIMSVWKWEELYENRKSFSSWFQSWFFKMMTLNAEKRGGGGRVKKKRDTRW